MKTMLENLLSANRLSSNCESKFFRQEGNATRVNLKHQK